MKKVLFTWAMCMIVTGMFLFAGCALIKVKGKTFKFESARVDYAGAGTPNLSVLENERINLINTYKNFKLIFLDNGTVNLNNNTLYYYQDGDEVELYENAERTIRFKDSNNLKIKVNNNSVAVTTFGQVNTETEGFVYIVIFSEFKI